MVILPLWKFKLNISIMKFMYQKAIRHILRSHLINRCTGQRISNVWNIFLLMCIPTSAFTIVMLVSKNVRLPPVQINHWKQNMANLRLNITPCRKSRTTLQLPTLGNIMLSHIIIWEIFFKTFILLDTLVKDLNRLDSGLNHTLMIVYIWTKKLLKCLNGGSDHIIVDR